MPYADKTAAKLADREKKRRKRERQRAEAARQDVIAAAAPAVAPAADPAGELAAWARERLIVPSGHPAAGKPMELPAFAEAFLREGWGARESALSVGRKNAKSAICAVLALGFLCGPLKQPGWRGAIASVSKDKAKELRDQVAAIARASGLADVRIRHSPYPGAIETDTGKLETLSADRTSGHASGFDLVIVDETGLMPERARETLAGLRSSVSAKGGRVLHISVRGDSPLFREILDNPTTVSHVYAAPADCELADRDAWAAANPGLGAIKSVAYMEDAVARIAAGAAADEPTFRAFDLNQALSPTAELIV
ncbi:MAG: terminase large subunit, partial [Rhodospirillaceae bacterium]|nr:terminase large subunit [Rhodospirillaceae bacterium]